MDLLTIAIVFVAVIIGSIALKQVFGSSNDGFQGSNHYKIGENYDEGGHYNDTSQYDGGGGDGSGM